jgi:hypothetical protein
VSVLRFFTEFIPDRIRRGFRVKLLTLSTISIYNITAMRKRLVSFVASNQPALGKAGEATLFDSQRAVFYRLVVMNNSE